MADSEVVTELTLDASGSTDEMAQFQDAMQKIELVLEQMLGVMTGTTNSFKTMGDQIQLTSSTIDGHSQVLSSFTSNLSNASAATAGFNTASTSAAAGSNLLADAFTELQRGASAATAGLGTVNALIGALAAGGILAIVAEGFKALSDAANSQGDAADKIKSLADGFGLTVDQTQALITAGSQLDQTQDAITSGLTRFSEQLDGVRQGTGNLYTELMRVNPALVLQMQTTSSMGQELNLLAQAYDQAGTGADKLAKTALGNSSLGGMLQSISDNSGMNGLTAAMSQFETATSDELVRWADLKDQINQTKAQAEGIFDSIFTESMLQGELSTAQFMDEFAAAAKSFVVSDDFNKIIDFFSGKGWNATAGILSFFQALGDGIKSHVSSAGLLNSDGSINWLGSPDSGVVSNFANQLLAGFEASWERDASPAAKQFLQDQFNMILNGVKFTPPDFNDVFSQVGAGAVSSNPIASPDLDNLLKQQTADTKLFAAALDELDAAQSKIPLSAAAAFNENNAMIAVLGGAATATELMTNEQLKMNASMAKSPLIDDSIVARRGMQYKDLQIQIAAGQQLLSANIGTHGEVLSERAASQLRGHGKSVRGLPKCRRKAKARRPTRCAIQHKQQRYDSHQLYRAS